MAEVPMAKTLIDIRTDHATILYQCRRTTHKAQVNEGIKFYHSSNSPLTINLGVGVVMLMDWIIRKAIESVSQAEVTTWISDLIGCKDITLDNKLSNCYGERNGLLIKSPMTLSILTT